MLLLVYFSGCKQTSEQKIDEFYTEKGEWDSARIPFIKPYEAIILTSGWLGNEYDRKFNAC